MPDYHKLIDEYDYFFCDYFFNGTTQELRYDRETQSYITKSDSKLKAHKSLERIDDICEQNRFLRKNITAMLNKIDSYNKSGYIARYIQDIHDSLYVSLAITDDTVDIPKIKLTGLNNSIRNRIAQMILSGIKYENAIKLGRMADENIRTSDSWQQEYGGASIFNEIIAYIDEHGVGILSDSIRIAADNIDSIPETYDGDDDSITANAKLVCYLNIPFSRQFIAAMASGQYDYGYACLSAMRAIETIKGRDNKQRHNGRNTYQLQEIVSCTPDELRNKNITPDDIAEIMANARFSSEFMQETVKIIVDGKKQE